MKILIKYDTNWADEMDLQGFAILDSSQWNSFVEQIHNFKYPFEYYFGTNEWMEYDNAEQVLADFVEIENVTGFDLERIEKIFGKQFGHFPSNLVEEWDQYIQDPKNEHDISDNEADAQTLASAGFGTDEDYSR